MEQRIRPDQLRQLVGPDTNPQALLAGVLDMLCTNTGAAGAAIWLRDALTGVPVERARRGDFRSTEAARATAFSDPAESGMSPIVLESGRLLSVPVRLGKTSVGALLVERSTPFTAAEIDSIAAVARQLARLLDEASLLFEAGDQHENIAGVMPARDRFEGRVASPGFARGTALVLERTARTDAVVPAQPGTETLPFPDVDAALRAFDQALERTRTQIEELQRETEERLSDVVTLIFSAHLLMLNDDAFTGSMRRRITEGSQPGDAIASVVDEFSSLFARVEGTRIAEKVQDLHDLGYRLKSNLEANPAENLDYGGRIVVAEHIYPSELVKLAVQNVRGAVFYGTGTTAHIAILARSLGLPLIIVDDAGLLEIPNGTRLELRASDGLLLVDPLPTRGPEAIKPDEPAAESRPLPNGIRILANINLIADLEPARLSGASGIGLYRSEFPFIIRDSFPGEDEQYRIYRRITDAYPDGPVRLRTADIGGDKLVGVDAEVERNPFLGVRGIRFSLANLGLFRQQLRAMLRAGHSRNVGIMFPMVSSVEEMEEAHAVLRECQHELMAQGIPHSENPAIGAMIELPSAVEALDELADLCDFFSIGTNDLVMYLLGVDRTNDRLSELYRSYHPAVLRVIRRIVTVATERNVNLSICGDSAADPSMLPFYIGVGIRNFSVSPQSIPALHRAAASLTLDDARTRAEAMLSTRSAREMQHMIRIYPASMVH